MSILISAPIRTGKTLRTIKHIFDELNKGRQVYTNIVGIKIDGVISVASSIADPFDWRNLPNGSVLVWDEAHEHPAFSEQDLLKNYELANRFEYDDQIETILDDISLKPTEKKSKIDEVERKYKKDLERKKEEIRDIGRALLLHGHFGIEIYFITQRVTKLNTDVLASVTTHYVMRRKFGWDQAIIWEFGEAMTTWSKSTAQIALNKTVWRFPKHLYKFYISSENHQVKQSYPKEVIMYACIALAFIGFALFKGYQTGFFGIFGDKQQTVSTQEPVQNNQGEVEAVELPKDSKEALQLEKLQAESLGLTVEQLRDLKNPEKRNQEIAEQQAQYNATYKISYNPADPYASKVDAQYQATSLPKFSGCIKFNGKYTAYTEQGTKINDVNPSACKRLIDDGDRPYDYFKENNNAMVSQNYNPQTNQQVVEQNIQQIPMTREQLAKYQQYIDDTQKNQIDSHLQSRTVNGANAL